ncbi:hypothetical protein GCM10009733_043420 [Nonomuraea maheshkhaliensis]|uniref:Uncharacterized protein n=1 Tax=Nonomuraea maheshkhaliensis TaxID=419590 RepID=A0ABP4RDJ5_9ACTN
MNDATDNPGRAGLPSAGVRAYEPGARELPGDQGLQRLGVGHGDDVPVERVRVAEPLLGRSLRHHRLDRAGRDGGDPAGRAEVLEAAELRVLGHQPQRHVVERADDLPGDAGVPADEEGP